MLYATFENSKAVWEGALPQRGEFVQRFWICFGSSISEAKRLSGQSQQCILGREANAEEGQNARYQKTTRKMSAIDPAQVSKSYRRICNRDFRDVEDKYHTPEQRRRNKGTEQYHFAVRSNDTLDAIDHEQKLLSFNLPATGAILEQFVCSLGIILQWEPLLAGGVERIAAGGENNKRQEFAFLYAQWLLGALDFADDPFSYQFLQVPLGEATASFMSKFFSGLDPSKVLWFQAIEEEG